MDELSDYKFYMTIMKELSNRYKYGFREFRIAVEWDQRDKLSKILFEAGHDEETALEWVLKNIRFYVKGFGYLEYPRYARVADS